MTTKRTRGGENVKGLRTGRYPLSKPRKKQKAWLPQPYAAITNYLKKNGWNVFVIGGTSVEQGSNKFNFIFRCSFTGGKLAPKSKLVVNK